MRSNLSCGACVSRSLHPRLQQRAQLYVFGSNLSKNHLRRLSTPTGHPKGAAGAGPPDTKTGQEYNHASAATCEVRHPHSTSPKAQISSSPEQLTTPNVPSPQTDLSSTRPALLNHPGAPVGEADGSITLKSRATHIFRIGKAYIGFYKAGFMKIWSNYKEYQDLRRRLEGADIHHLARSEEATPKLSRRDFQLYLRTRHDIKKLVPFALVFGVCGEFTPLVIVALGTAVVPYTCRIPKQVEKDLKKTLSRVDEVERRVGQLRRAGGVDDMATAMAYVHGLDPFGIALRRTPVLGALLWRFWVEPRFKRRMEDIICDAILIIKDGGPAGLEAEELFQIAVDMVQVDTIKLLIDHGALGTPQSAVPDSAVKHARKSLESFIDGVRQHIKEQKDGKGAAFHDQPQSIFVAASRHAQSRGLGGPYFPPLSPKSAGQGN